MCRCHVARFYTENGLRVLNEWLFDGVHTKAPGMSKEKKRIEMYSQVRALLRVRPSHCGCSLPPLRCIREIANRHAFSHSAWLK